MFIEYTQYRKQSSIVGNHKKTRDLEGCVMSRKGFRLVRKESVSIEWSRQKEWIVGVGSCVALIDNLVKTGSIQMESSGWNRVMEPEKNQKRL